MKFYPFFQNCIGTADGTHILAKVPTDKMGCFCNRKGDISHNVLSICTFNLQFCYILLGWEGSGHDSL
ncbi:hypothetical protein NEOLI_004645 [Neolecta irregularis DAH-3]|uniref:DDE Tnp4 domain-containing protein n=1 Tax=Neolecta irregularis (strain DAH-3) TaxID=1198029 RepID=A0A1U7LV80_NEOID|nr:hypothetical protein NEOLI_004645 [Neolecta irregularis DAH-3]|eukprot:OLL26586.1 hypothetical protein NEOLI_004645 [Neolecta irregularis DAH-3]